MANPIEREGIYYCGKIAASHKWMFREQPIDDIGIDAHMEITDELGKTKQLLALQIKSGPSWFKEIKSDYVIFRDINDRQYNYWIENPLPCIVVLYNPGNDMCIWQTLTSETIEKTKGGDGKGFFVKVPLSQIFLDSLSNERLINFTNLPEYITNYNFILSQKVFMQILQNDGTIKLHSKEWVNKSSGKGETELIVFDGDNTKKYLYPYFFPFTPYIEVFPRLFPWADFSIDEDFYEENDEFLWREFHCYYDKEEGEWLIVGDTFEEFRKKLPPVRSINHSGEVAEYMLVLTLNELGKSFLYVDNFISKKLPYVSARPKEE